VGGKNKKIGCEEGKKTPVKKIQKGGTATTRAFGGKNVGIRQQIFGRCPGMKDDGVFWRHDEKKGQNVHS